MKKIGSLFFILLLAVVTVFCVAACGSEPSDNGGKEDPTDSKASYEITVDASGVSVDAGDISVCVYSLDGTLVGEKRLSQGKTLFELKTGSYVATLGGVAEEVSFSSILLTKDLRKVKIVLENSEYDDYAGKNQFAVTVIVIADDRSVERLNVQICDERLCSPVPFENGNVADVFLGSGEYEVKVLPSDGSLEDLYHEKCTVTSEKRFCVIVL